MSCVVNPTTDSTPAKAGAGTVEFKSIREALDHLVRDLSAKAQRPTLRDRYEAALRAFREHPEDELAQDRFREVAADIGAMILADAERLIAEMTKDSQPLGREPEERAEEPITDTWGEWRHSEIEIPRRLPCGCEVFLREAKTERHRGEGSGEAVAVGREAKR